MRERVAELELRILEEIESEVVAKSEGNDTPVCLRDEVNPGLISDACRRRVAEVLRKRTN